MRVELKPELLRWARERAGFDLAALAKRFPQLPAWESGDARPTLKQLEKFAKATYAPIGFLFLPEPPPVEQVPIPDFRTVGNRHVERPSPDLLDTLYICQQRQEWYRDFARSEREDPLSFVGSVGLASNVETAATRIRTALGFDVEARREIPTWTDALRQFIGQADDLTPLVFINGADSKSAQMFTLAHELAHIWLGQSALSDVGPASSPSNDVEIWCNRVAAELLAPLGARRHENRGRAELREESSPSAWVSRRFARALIRSTFEGQTSFTEAFRLLGFKKMAQFRRLNSASGPHESRATLSGGMAC